MSAFRIAWGAWTARRLLWRWRMRPVPRHGRSERAGYSRFGWIADLEQRCIQAVFNPKFGSSVIAYHVRIGGFGDDEHSKSRSGGSPGG
jgi:hypothetical protein